MSNRHLFAGISLLLVAATLFDSLAPLVAEAVSRPVETLNLTQPFGHSEWFHAAPIASAYGSIRGVAVTETGDVVFAARSTFASGVFVVKDPQDLSTPNAYTTLVGTTNRGCVNSSEFSMTMPTFPNSVTLINRGTVALTEGMYSSRILSLSSEYLVNITDTAGTGVNVSQMVGVGCSFRQQFAFEEGAFTTSVSSKIAPPDFVAYYGPTDQLFFTQKTFIAEVKEQRMYRWFGSFTEQGQRAPDQQLQNGYNRLDAKTSYPGQMAIVDDEQEKAMYVADHTGQIRKISFNPSDPNNEVVSWVLGIGTLPPIPGQPINAFHWPPPNCSVAADGTGGCLRSEFYIVNVVALVAARRIKGNGAVSRELYFVDKTLGLVFAFDLATSSPGGVRLIAGTQPDYDGSMPDPASDMHIGVGHQLAVSGDALWIADGNLRKYTFPDGTTESLLPEPAGCTVFNPCNGNALNAYGVPATGCICDCKPEWDGQFCDNRIAEVSNTTRLTQSHSLDITATREYSVSASLLIEPPETPEPAIPPVVVEVGTTTATVATTVIAVVNPTVATQGSRSSLLLRIGKCNPNFGEELDWVQSVFQLEFGVDDLRFYRGAVVGNMFAVMSFCFVFASIAFFSVKWYKEESVILNGFARVRFPGITAFPLLLIYEGTVMASMVLMTHGIVAREIIGGILGMLMCVVIAFGIAYVLMEKRFDTHFMFFPKHDESKGGRGDNPLQRCKICVCYWLNWLFWEEGKWVNRKEKPTPGTARKPDQCKHYINYRNLWGGFFRDYKEHRQKFILGEFFMCLCTGILDGVHPEPGAKCIAVVIMIALAYCGMFIAILVLRPYLQRLAIFFAIAVAGLQAVSAVQLVALVITNDPDWERASGSFALASIYVLAIDGMMTFADIARKIIYYVWKKCCRADDDSSEGSNKRRPALQVPLNEEGYDPFNYGERRVFNFEDLSMKSDSDAFNSRPESLRNSMVTPGGYIPPSQQNNEIVPDPRDEGPLGGEHLRYGGHREADATAVLAGLHMDDGRKVPTISSSRGPSFNPLAPDAVALPDPRRGMHIKSEGELDATYLQGAPVHGLDQTRGRTGMTPLGPSSTEGTSGGTSNSTGLGSRSNDPVTNFSITSRGSYNRAGSTGSILSPGLGPAGTPQFPPSTSNGGSSGSLSNPNRSFSSREPSVLFSTPSSQGPSTSAGRGANGRHLRTNDSNSGASGESMEREKSGGSSKKSLSDTSVTNLLGASSVAPPGGTQGARRATASFEGSTNKVGSSTTTGGGGKKKSAQSSHTNSGDIDQDEYDAL